MNFSELTTLQIGGPVKEFYTAETEQELINYVSMALEKKLPYLVIGGGSNLLVSDNGFEGVVIKNQIKGRHILGNNLVVKSGEILQNIVDFANESGFSGLESLAGIPGTIGGAVYGNAGAYGQTISDHLISVKYFNPKEYGESSMLKEDCGFAYRDSVFKKTKNIILEITISLNPADPEQLKQFSLEITKKREVKYPPGIKCPGSFFKNIIASELPAKVLEGIPEDRIVYGKVPAGALLELVGAKGDQRGEIEIAPYHANLFINRGNGKASDFYNLAKEYFDKVKEKFWIELEPEVQFVNLDSFSTLKN